MTKKRDCKNTNTSLFHKTILDSWGKIRFKKKSSINEKKYDEIFDEKKECTEPEKFYHEEVSIKEEINIKENIEEDVKKEEPQEFFEVPKQESSEKIKLFVEFSEYYRTKIKRTITLLKLALIAVTIFFAILIFVQWKNIYSLPSKIASINTRLDNNDLRFEMQKAINRSTSAEKVRELKKLTLRQEFKPLLAEIYFNMGYFSEYYYDRLDYFHAALEINPYYAEIYNLRGVMRYENRELDGALEDYEEAIKLKADFAEAYNNRGVVLYEKKKINAAILDFNKAIELNPDFSETYYNRGRAFFDKKQYKNSIADYQKAVDLNPKDKESKRMIAEVRNVMNKKATQTPNKKVIKKQKSSKKEISQVTV
ncbi:MAG: tetratricopeptide repeat protein [Fusobacteriaceae bacterium]